MTTTSAIVLILGAGPRVGASIAERFLKQGYKVAVASRSGQGLKSTTNTEPLTLKADFSDPTSIAPLFNAVKTEFGNPPNIVIYNAAALTPPPDKDAPLSLPVESVMSDLNVNTVSAYIAAQQAVNGWSTLPENVKKTFIYTGNILNVTTLPVPWTLNLGMGKAASASWIGLVDSTYSAKGYRFFYADERYPDGKSKSAAIDGPAHADFYAQLASDGKDIPWHATFVKNQGYVKF